MISASEIRCLVQSGLSPQDLVSLLADKFQSRCVDIASLGEETCQVSRASLPAAPAGKPRALPSRLIC